MTGGPPDKLNNRHKFLAALIALGWSNTRAARELGMHPNRVSTIAQSPLFKAIVEQKREAYEKELTSDLLASIREDGPKTFKFLQEMRDAQVPDFDGMTPVDRTKLRLQAAQTLFDRQVPKKVEATGGAAGVTVIVEAADRSRLDRALRAAAIDVDATPIADLVQRLEQAEQSKSPEDRIEGV